MSSLLPLLLAAAVFGAAGQPAAPPPGSPDARITYYSPSVWSESCGFGAPGSPTLPSPQLLAAVDTAFYNGSAVCGACANISLSGPAPAGYNSTITVLIVDQCPAASNPRWCSGDKHQFVLTSPSGNGSAAFSTIAPATLGVVPTNGTTVPAVYTQPLYWEFVPCTSSIGGSGTIGLWFRPGSGQYYLAVTVTNHRLPIESVESKCEACPDSAYVPGARTTYNAFVFNNTAALGNLTTFRVTSNTGQSFETTAPLSAYTVPAGQNGTLFNTFQQFS